MKTREKHFNEIFNHEYVYNVIIKHLILNEKFTKWFFVKIKNRSINNILTLQNEQKILHTNFQTQLSIAIKYYQEFYFLKNSKDVVREEILINMIVKIFEKNVSKLSRFVKIKKSRTFIVRAFLKEFFKTNNFFCEFHKTLLKHKFKNKKSRNDTIIKRYLTSFFKRFNSRVNFLRNELMIFLLFYTKIKKNKSIWKIINSYL